MYRKSLSGIVTSGNSMHSVLMFCLAEIGFTTRMEM